MALWGIELKPGNPITLSFVRSLPRPKLLVSQATLGMGESTDKSVVQCTLGDRSPFVLATLVPNKKETAYLELEIGKGNVIFTVIGPRSVYLSGYHFIPSKSRDCHCGPDQFYYFPHDDSDEEYYDEHDYYYDDDDDEMIYDPPDKFGITEENWNSWMSMKRSKAGRKAVADLPSSFDEKVTLKEY